MKKNRVGLRCLPYPMLGKKRVGTITRDGGHFIDVIYEKPYGLDQVCSSLTEILPTQIEFEFEKSNAAGQTPAAHKETP